MPELAPWLQINPLAGVPMFLQGYGQGASVGESRRRSEERAYEADLQAAAQQERNEILREARQIQAKEFAENLKLKQEAAQRAAKMAAIRLEGQQGLERDLQSGMTFQQAFPRHAPKLLFEEPASMAQIFAQTQPKQYAPSEFERRMEYALRKGFVSPEEAPTLTRESFLGPTESTEMTMDEQGRPSLKIVKGRGAQGQAGPTTAVRTDIQKRLLGFEKGVSMANRLLSKLRPENVGLAGWAHEVVVDETLAQAFPELANKQNVSARTLMGIFNETMLKTLKADSQLNKEEEKRILRVLPKLTGRESFPSAVTKIESTLEELRDLSKIDARVSGVQLPPSLMSPEDIRSEVGKSLTLEQAMQLIRQYHPNFRPNAR